MSGRAEHLDELDRRIVDLLVADGRMSFRELGDAVGLGPSATADRVRALTRRGVIRGFTATIDPRAEGRGLEAIVDLRLRSNAERAQFEAQISDMPAVAGAVHLTGAFDYQLSLACADAEEIDATIAALKDGGGVSETRTRVVLRRVV